MRRVWEHGTEDNVLKSESANENEALKKNIFLLVFS